MGHFRFLRARTLVLAMVVALGAAACGDGNGDTTDDGDDTGVTAPEGAATISIHVDGDAEDSNVALLGYFPSEVTVRQGDTVEFPFQPGDPHTVTFGSLIDEAIAVMGEAQGGEEGEEGEEPEVFGRIPFAFSDDGQALIYGGALPCFTEADPPVDGQPCEQVEQPAFDGSHAFYNSGLLPPRETFSMQIAEDAAPGTYSYLCLLHGPDMSGSITVVGADEAGQTAAEVDEAREAELQALLDAAAPALAAQPEGTLPGFEDFIPQGAGNVLAGGFFEGDRLIDILQFGPVEVEIAAGDSVTWMMLGFHTISFNAPQDATPPIIEGGDGLPTLNPLAFAPQGGAAGAPPPPEGEGPPPEGPPGPPTLIEAGEWDGTGFFSSGVLPSFPPSLLAYDITFTTPGTYQYVCLIHEDMEGTVNVT